MAKSTTKNESASFDIEKIRRFTQDELARIADAPSELPFCYQIATDVLVGHSKIQKINDKCWRVWDRDKQIWDFFNRKDAIYYCIAVHKQQSHLAQEIKQHDNTLNKLEFDAALYRHRYKKAQEKQDQWGEEYFSARYSETMNRITQTKKELTKSLNLAKYIKV